MKKKSFLVASILILNFVSIRKTFGDTPLILQLKDKEEIVVLEKTPLWDELAAIHLSNSMVFAEEKIYQCVSEFPDQISSITQYEDFTDRCALDAIKNSFPVKIYQAVKKILIDLAQDPQFQRNLETNGFTEALYKKFLDALPIGSDIEWEDLQSSEKFWSYVQRRNQSEFLNKILNNEIQLYNAEFIEQLVFLVRVSVLHHAKSLEMESQNLTCETLQKFTCERIGDIVETSVSSVLGIPEVQVAMKFGKFTDETLAIAAGFFGKVEKGPEFKGLKRSLPVPPARHVGPKLGDENIFTTAGSPKGFKPNNPTPKLASAVHKPIESLTPLKFRAVFQEGKLRYFDLTGKSLQTFKKGRQTIHASFEGGVWKSTTGYDYPGTTEGPFGWDFVE